MYYFYFNHRLYLVSFKSYINIKVKIMYGSFHIPLPEYEDKMLIEIGVLTKMSNVYP